MLDVPNKRASTTYYVAIILTFLVIVINIVFLGVCLSKVWAAFQPLMLTALIPIGGIILHSALLLGAYFKALLVPTYLTDRYYGYGSSFSYPMPVTSMFLGFASWLSFVPLRFYLWGDVLFENIRIEYAIFWLLFHLPLLITQSVLVGGMLRQSDKDGPEVSTWTLLFKPFIARRDEFDWMPQLVWMEMDEKDIKMLHSQIYTTSTHQSEEAAAAAV